MPQANHHRSADRAAAIILRTSPDRRRQLRRKADELGISLQSYMEWKLFDLAEMPTDRKVWRPSEPRMEETSA